MEGARERSRETGRIELIRQDKQKGTKLHPFPSRSVHIRVADFD